MNRYGNDNFAWRYAAVTAYGYQNGFGASEGLYRAMNELAFERFQQDEHLSILDVGCGVGRTSGDMAAHYGLSDVTAIDSAQPMLTIAEKMNKSTDKKSFSVDMSSYGFGTLTMQPRHLSNLTYRLSDAEAHAKNNTGAYDLITCMNVLDRAKDIPEFLDALRDLLKNDGVMILCTPLNLETATHWQSYRTAESVRQAVEQAGFVTETFFDGLPYIEPLDARGAFEQFPTLFIRAHKASLI